MACYLNTNIIQLQKPNTNQGKSKYRNIINYTYHKTVLIMTPDNKQSTVTIYKRNFKNSMIPSLRTYVNAIDETAKN